MRERDDLARLFMGCFTGEDCSEMPVSEEDVNRVKWIKPKETTRGVPSKPPVIELRRTPVVKVAEDAFTLSAAATANLSRSFERLSFEERQEAIRQMITEHWRLAAEEG